MKAFVTKRGCSLHATQCQPTMRIAVQWLTVPLLAVVLTACGSNDSSKSTPDDQLVTPPTNPQPNPPTTPVDIQPLTAQMVLDLTDDAAFFDQGFPSAIKQKPSGKIDFSHFPREKHISTVDWRAVAETTDGFSPMSPVYIRFDSNIAVDAVALNLPQNAAAYLEQDASVQLINIDAQSPEYGRRHPLNVDYYPDADKYRPGNLLAVQPLGRLMQENTQYALIVTRAIHSNASETAVSPMLTALLNGINPRQLDLTISPITAAKSLQGYQPLRQWLADQEQFNQQQILAATVWRTGQPTAYLQNLVDAMANWPVQLDEPWQLVESNDQYCAIRSSWQAPVLIKGLSGYLLPVFGGQIELDQQGQPLIQHYRQSEIVLTLPKTQMPIAGFPMMLYNHGTDGRADQILTRGYTNAQGEQTSQGTLAEIAAIRGWAVSGMAGHMGSEHQDLVDLWDGLFDGLSGFSFNHFSYNPLNPMAMRNNLLQMITERVLYRRLINQQQIDASICQGLQTPEGLIQFDLQTQVASGQSLGSFTAASMAVVDPTPYQGMTVSGAGTFSLDLVLNFVIEGKYLSGLFEPAYWQLPEGSLKDDPLHPFWALAESALAPANSGLQVNRWQYEKAQQKPHNLIFEGFFDSQVSVTSQKYLLRAMSVDFAGEELDLSDDKLLLPAIELADGQQLDFPVQANQQQKTNVVVRYAQDANMDGHHVLFQYDQAKHQLGCFLHGISNDQPPVIVQGVSIDGACEIVDQPN
ncbi:hypothetical protein [Pelagibaculum spongiae]|uniref:Uncharacterized protein n=1 Tax=Pelagibaculum spongiae TaxID=2080658 RepID=A0A2V1GQN4_9GAMM|nr:hypothetical protein [Pelagibaculum spongiae]PVZ66368.1 hypothetical protein DC094_16860 [Pelagibaculum spongiae]